LAPSRELGPRLRLLSKEDEARMPSVTLSSDLCAVPGCVVRPQRGVHHIEPRSRTGGPREYVLIDGVNVPNLCKLCDEHHDAVTGGVGGHRAKIVWSDHFAWVWYSKHRDLWVRRGKLRGV